MGWIIAYAAIACVCWGFFIACVPDEPTTNFWMATIWPLTLLCTLGYLLARGR